MPHGEANQLMVAPVLRVYKTKKPAGKLNRLEAPLGSIVGFPAGESLAACLDLLEKILPCKPLREYGIRREEYPGFCEGAVSGQQRLLNNNYAELTYTDMLAIYESSH